MRRSNSPTGHHFLTALEANPSSRAWLVVAYLAAMLQLCHVGNYVFGNPADWITLAVITNVVPARDPYYIGLFGLTLVGAGTFILRPCGWSAWKYAIPIAVVAIAIIIVLLWEFNLDDKWVYYRTSRNAFLTGLPILNVGEMFNVNTSFLYPYLTAPGNFFGDFPQWEEWTKLLGLFFLFAAPAAILIFLGIGPAAILTAAALLFYVPGILWSLGGLETPIAAFWLVLCVLVYLDRGARLWIWFFLGAIIWLRPDAILVGIGIFAAEFIMNPRSIGRHLANGAIFSIPILAFIILNQWLFGRPLPSPFYVKGLNKAFSGHPGHVIDVLIGLTHLASGLCVSFLVIFLIGSTGFLIRNSWRKKEASGYLAAFTGVGIFLAYHVAGGYQHMNFAFRYFIPGIAALTTVSGHYLVRSKAPISQSLAANAIAFQVVLSVFLAYHAKFVDTAFTVSGLRDRFSVHAYADFMKTWIEAGLRLRTLVKPGDRVFVVHGLATAAITDAYFRDKFYAPPNLSRFADLKKCTDDCPDKFDYYLIWPTPAFWPPNFTPVAEYPNLDILRRNAPPTK